MALGLMVRENRRVPFEMAIWRMTEDGPVALSFSRLGIERRLEDMIVSDPALTGSELLVIGRQVPTDFGGSIDVLAVDSDGRLHVLELKRDRTPRDVVAQALDYGSWVRGLTLEVVEAIFAEQHDDSLASAFAERFGLPVPDVFNADHQLTIVASELDASSDRIVTYLAEFYGVPINAVFFRYFADDGAEYLARTWLIPPAEAEVQRARGRQRGAVRPWNGRDYYVVLGNVEQGADRWLIGAKYGFVGAGGGDWYWKPLRNLARGNRVFAYVGGTGYVGVGEVTGSLIPLRELEVATDGTPLRVVEQPDIPSSIRERALDTRDEVTEFAVPVRWLVKREPANAVMESGLFASQVTACKLRDDRTIDFVTRQFGLDGE